ncbi:ABC-three component system middle component 6 [uncultured Desulfobacter sp.]|uniref:ABC-three component system middle component 6 n=1 Tax=uncultured Desulfobacter sp. TaxID=240139 RepID=UPI0029F51886|nr:ABC-three component system middle component 6 [uncultured Desulfobacter sp.]
MILPTKHMPQDRALLTVGSHILRQLDSKKTVSALWEEISGNDIKENGNPSVSYDWFILALDLLYAIDAIEIHEGLLSRRASV